jgi:acyl transferase domain-containing protein/SAM-dependent methyltransferase/acyl carrier protein
MTTENQLEQLSPAKRAVYEIRKLRSRVEELERLRGEPVAIVGIGLRFPGNASTPEAFWKNLAGGVDCVTETPSSRWSTEAYYDADPDAPGKMYTRHGGFIADPSSFDADFFGISPREAATIDPQHRLALEVAWEALENAGCNPAGLAQSDSGVFLALGNGDYGRLAFRQATEIDAYTSTGNAFSVAAGRISHALGFHGPSMVVDTACSGSLVAIHLACQSLRAGECRLALAGGVNLILSPEININFSKSRMLSQDGRCKTFDAAADGYGRGEGCGLLVLKRLTDAQAQGDKILAVIRGSAINQDGRSGGLTVPNGSAQQAVIRQALANAGVTPEDVGYIEAHGTGTALGDPIEAHALAAVFGPGRAADNPLVLGSAKTNLGHLEAAAGVAGVIKAVLALQNQQIPPHLHFQKLNPHIDWAGLQVDIPVESRPWGVGPKRRVAGVSSFGFSGTNSHVVIEEAPAEQEAKAEWERPLHMLAVSARSAAALNEVSSQYAEAVAHSGAGVGDICYTANAGRSHFDHRAVYFAKNKELMHDALLHKAPAQGVKESVPEVVFLFSGQGAQFAGMGKELYATQPVFRRAIDEVAALMETELEKPLLEVLWGRATQWLDQTAYTQPALFAIEYALAEMWKSWGIRPAVVLGHSVGEYAAACVAGVYSLPDGVKLITGRARLMQAVSGQGAMAAVFASEPRIREALRGLGERVSIAAMNAPESVVISGYATELAIAEDRLRTAEVRVQRLAVSHGFHSPQMRSMEPGFTALAGEIRYAAPGIRLISSVTGLEIGGDEMSDPQYWVRQVRQPVLFRRAIDLLRNEGQRVFVEIGPGTTLLGLGRECLPESAALWAASLKKGRGEWEQILDSLGRLYVRGADIDWVRFDESYGRGRVSLPTYPFERRRYWLESASEPAANQPDDEKDWQAITDSASFQARQGRLDLNVARYAERWDWLDRLTSGYIVRTLSGLGGFKRSGERHSAQSLMAQCGIQPSYEKLMGRWLEKLVGEKVLEQNGLAFTSFVPLPQVELAPEIAEARQAFAGDSNFLEYVIACGESLPQILTGRMSALETLFPNGEFTRAEGLYQHAPLAAYFSSIARAALEGLQRERPGAALQVLEVGAGTGGTASALLPVLPKDRTVYHFTDVSDIFLNNAARKFAAYPFVSYEHLDIEREGVEATYGANSVDVIVATNVLHATRDIRKTIANVRSLLAPGGILILTEATDYLPWFDITTGLIEGWQRFEDGLRGDHPLLPTETWQTLLRDGGFEQVTAFPDSQSPAQVLGQDVIVGRVPAGGTRRKATLPVANRTVAEEKREEPTPALINLADLGAAERHETLVDTVRLQLAEVLRFDSVSRVDRKQRFMDMGLDSLMAIELRNRLGKALGAERPLSATLVFDYPTMDALADYLEKDILGFEEAAAPNDPAAERAGRAEELQQMDDEEVEAMLMAKLRSL